MDIKERLKSILEGTYLEEMALSKEEFDELYFLKRKLESAKKNAIFIKDPEERKNRIEEIEQLEERIHRLRAKGLEPRTG